MSLRNFDNSNSPRFITVVNDGATIVPPTFDGERIVVLGFAKVAKNAANEDVIPVQELFPSVAGTIGIEDMIELTKNASSDATPVKYPSEISIALEELQRAGVSSVQVIRIGNEARYRDVTARMARERYIALEAAYDLLVDLPIDHVYPVNVAMGLKGDGLYNALSYEVVFDPETAATAAPGDLAYSRIPGFVRIQTSDYEKDPIVSEPENLAYQLASICYRISTNGTLCSGVVRTLNPLEVKFLQNLDVVTLGGAGTFFGATGTAAAATVTAADSWALYKPEHLTADWDFAAVHTAVSGATVLNVIESAAYFVDKTTNLAKLYATGATVTIKPVFVATAKPTTALTSVESATEPDSTNLDILTWCIAYGTPASSEMKSWEKFLKAFGNGTAAVFKGNVASYTAWDGVTSALGDKPDNYRFYASANSELPSGISDTDVIADRRGRPIDIGYYLDVIASNSQSVSASNSLLDPVNGLSKPFNFVAGLGVTLGNYSLLPSSIANTRQLTTVVSALGFISSRGVSDLTRLRYQVFNEEDGNYLYGRDITGGHFVSDSVRTDFINRLTWRIVKDALDVARDTAKPLIGKGDSPIRREGLKQKLEQEYSKWSNPEDGRLRRPALVEVLSSNVGGVIGKLQIPLKLSVVNEILEIEAIATLEQ